MADGVYCPRIFDNEEGYPLPLADVGNVDAPQKNSERVDDEKGNVETLFVTRNFLVVGDVEEPVLYVHNDIVYVCT